MMNDRVHGLESLCFDYEDDTFQGMIRFATEIRDRRLQYCRERQAFLQEQRAALAANAMSSTSTPPPPNQRYPANVPSLNPASPVSAQRNFDPNQRIQEQFSMWSPGPNSSAGAGTGTVQQGQIRSPLPNPTDVAPLLPPVPPPLIHQPPLGSFVEPRSPIGIAQLAGQQSHSRLGEGPGADRRAQSTPTNCDDGRGHRMQFTPHMNTNSISSIPSARSNQQPSNNAEQSRASNCCGTGSNGVDTGTYGGGSSSQQQPFRHSCSMIDCPICQGPLRVCLTPLCSGDSSRGNYSTNGPITTVSGSYNSGTGATTRSTLFQEQLCADIPMTNSSGSQRTPNSSYPQSQSYSQRHFGDGTGRENFHPCQNSDFGNLIPSHPPIQRAVYTALQGAQQSSLPDVSDLLLQKKAPLFRKEKWMTYDETPPSEPFECFLAPPPPPPYHDQKFCSSDSESEGTGPFLPSPPSNEGKGEGTGSISTSPSWDRELFFYRKTST